MGFSRLNREVVGCSRCPRLTAYRQAVALKKKRQFAHDPYWGKPVPGFGDPLARVLLVGLAPAPHGSNRTGRMFTGDGTDGMGSSDFLMHSLHEAGYANQPTSRQSDDGLILTDAYLTAIARCAPPGNKLSAEEIANCVPFLVDEIALLKRLSVVVALGQVAFNQVLRLWVKRGLPLVRPRPRFAHGAEISLGDALPVLLAAYHPSRQNTQTGKLTQPMLTGVLQRARRLSEGV